MVLVQVSQNMTWTQSDFWNQNSNQNLFEEEEEPNTEPNSQFHLCEELEPEPESLVF
jgi:hypothetical protein